MTLKGSPDRAGSRSSRRRSRWLRRMLAAGLVVGVLAAVGIFLGKPLHHRWEVLQARAMAQEAKPHLEAERWEAAAKLLGEAYVKAPEDEEVLRGILDLVTKTGSDLERQLYFWRQILATGRGTTADRSGMAQVLVALGRTEEAGAILAAMSAEEQQGRHGLELKGSLARSEGRPDVAAEWFRKAWLAEPHDPECRLRLAMMDLRSPFKEVQDRASTVAWEVARGHDAHALTALELLAEAPRLTGSEVDELLLLLEAHPAKNDRRRYLLLTARLRVDPLNREAVLKEEAARVAGRPLEQSLDYLRWMVDSGGHEHLLEVLSRDQAMLKRELLPVYLEALAAAGKWEELRKALDDVPAGAVKPADEAFLRARLAQGLSETPSQIHGHLQEATRRAAAARDLRNLVRCATLAESLGYDEIAVEGFRAAAASPQHQAAMFARVLAIQERMKDPAAILATTERVLDLMPESREHWATVLYLKLLLGREIELALYHSVELSREGKLAPNASRFIEAFSAYRFNDLDRMRGLIVQVEADALPVGQRAVLAGLYTEAGDISRGYIIAERIAASLLNLPEQAFLKKAL